MNEKSIYNSMINWVKWYGIIVGGGILSLGKFAGSLAHDLWCKMRHIDNKEKYIIGKSATKQLIAGMTLLTGIVINIMNIVLIIPLLMGLQHLMKRKMQGLEKQEKHTSEALKDVKQWYDGILYATGIDPILRSVREKIDRYITEDSKVIDICCGTGKLVLCLSEKCEHVTGVDHSSDMIKYANKEKNGLANVEFVHADATSLPMYQDQIFDYAVLSFSIHEMPQYVRIPVLREAARIAKEVIIADYMIPMPVNRTGIMNLYMEFVAGYGHFQNYLSYRNHGGLDNLIGEVALTIEKETDDSQGTFRVVKTKQNKN